MVHLPWLACPLPGLAVARVTCGLLATPGLEPESCVTPAAARGRPRCVRSLAASESLPLNTALSGLTHLKHAETPDEHFQVNIRNVYSAEIMKVAKICCLGWFLSCNLRLSTLMDAGFGQISAITWSISLVCKLQLSLYMFSAPHVTIFVAFFV